MLEPNGPTLSPLVIIRRLFIVGRFKLHILRTKMC